MRTQIGAPAKYGDRRSTIQFAVFPRVVTRRIDGSRWLIWMEAFVLQEKYYETASLGWQSENRWLVEK